jgi:hypothetical protein
MVAITRPDTDDVQKLNVMRLAVYVNVLSDGEQYKEMAQLALENKLAGEAQTRAGAGFTKNVFTDQRLKDVEYASAGRRQERSRRRQGRAAAERGRGRTAARVMPT